MTETNKAIRLLEGTRLKFTSVVQLKDGRRLEIQHNKPLAPAWFEEARELLLSHKLSDDYSSGACPIVRWADVEFIDTEPNPEAAK